VRITKESERGALTSCRAEAGKIRTPEEGGERGTLTLCQVQSEGQVRTKKNRQREGHSRSVEHRRDKSGHRKNTSKKGKLTPYRAHREGQVRTPKSSEQARSTHSLRSAERWQVRKHKETERENKGCSLPIRRRGKDRWEH
jgi:hypothetical protein